MISAILSGQLILDFSGKMKKISAAILFLVVAISGINAQEEVYATEKLSFCSNIYDEYAPVPFNKGLIFVGNMRTTFFYTYNNEKQKAPWTIFYVRKRGKTEWTEPEIWQDELKTNANDGPLTIDTAGTIIYFSQNYDAPKGLGNIRNQSRVGIFKAELVNKKWKNIVPFEHNDDKYSTMHPSLSPNGKLLFFSSNRRDGQGGFDIYVCKKTGDTWSEPVNLGPLVNTPGHEVMPFYQSTGRLFFSSNRHPGLGKYDIYYTENVDGVWVTPVNLGAPINSKRDDISFAADNKLKEGYFASDRDRRSASIYSFKLTAPEFEVCEEQKEPDYCFTFFEENTPETDTTNLVYEWRVEGKRIRGREAPYCFSRPGRYIIELNVIDLLTDSVMYNQATYDFLLEDEQQVYITAPDTVFVDQTIHLDNNKTYLKNFEIERFYWDMGDDIHKSDTAVDHRYFKPGIYSVKCGATSVADTPKKVKKTCSIKKIIVLPKPGFAKRED
jgi:hypothetical protein